MNKYNLYDNGELVLKNVRSGIIRNMLGISSSRLTNLVDTGALCKGRYKVERSEIESSDRETKETVKLKQHAIGEDMLREWDEVTRMFRSR